MARRPRLAAPILALAVGACAPPPPAPRLGVEGHLLRLHPGDDVKASLEAFAREQHLRAATVSSAVGSLTDVGLRFANQHETTRLTGHFEVVSLSGYLAEGELHLHMAVSDGEGRTVGGHFADGNRVYTTLVVAIDEHLGVRYRRERDPKTNRDELVVAPR
jgi:predicted DNA-binding protein with PD1-like motif